MVPSRPTPDRCLASSNADSASSRNFRFREAEVEEAIVFGELAIRPHHVEGGSGVQKSDGLFVVGLLEDGISQKF